MMRPPARPSRFGFTLVELLIVIVILGILIALLLPAIQAAVRSARTASVSAEINQMAQALADFKNKYGDYPPSRIILSENGFYDTSSATATTTYMTTAANQGADITYAQLAQRSVTFFRKFFPRVVLSTSGAAPNLNIPTGSPPYALGPPSPTWYDFNGNGVYDAT